MNIKISTCDIINVSHIEKGKLMNEKLRCKHFEEVNGTHCCLSPNNPDHDIIVEVRSKTVLNSNIRLECEGYFPDEGCQYYNTLEDYIYGKKAH